MQNDELMVQQETVMTAETEVIGAVIREMMAPVMQAMAQFMADNTEALNRVAAAQKVQAERMEALEKQIRLNTLVTPSQVKYINDAIRKRARELLAPKKLEDDAQAVKRLSGMIRKAVNMRYGVSGVHDIPKHEYAVVLTQISAWNDALAVMDTVKEARKRNEQKKADAQAQAAE